MNDPVAPVDPSEEIYQTTAPTFILVVQTIFVTVSVSVRNVKSAASVSLQFVVMKGTRPDVSAISLRANSFLAGPVVIVAYHLSVKNSTAPAIGVVSNVPDVITIGAVHAVAVPAARVR